MADNSDDGSVLVLSLNVKIAPPLRWPGDTGQRLSPEILPKHNTSLIGKSATVDMR